MPSLKPLVLSLCFCVPVLAPLASLAQEPGAAEVRVSISEGAVTAIAALGLQVPIVGRIFFIVARDDEQMPHLGTGVTGNPLWGVDVRDFGPGDRALIRDGDTSVSGYPFNALADLPPGDYHVQAFINVYTTFHRSDGHVIEAHMNSGAFQSPFKSPGNAYSEVQSVTVGEQGLGAIDLTISEVIQPSRPLQDGEVLQQGNFEDTVWVRYIKIRSEKLSAFWGRDMYIGANVLLPSGYEERPDATFPVLYMQGHSSGLTPMPWAPAPWFRPGYEPEHVAVGPQLEGFYEAWTAGELPKIVVITIRDANPFFDTSYSVNSPNVGPYADAIYEELIPHLEAQFRIVAEPWGRVLAGRSTGGWEAAAMMVFNPERFAGAFPWAPDPIDFRKLMQINIYDSNSAFYNELEWIRTPLPAQRDIDGIINYSVLDEHRYEQVVATKDRSGGQWAIWQALYSPVADDGYPAPLWDPDTGEINREVATYWREHWDLSHIIQRDWPRLGPKLAGKLHFAVGRRDNYYLEQAVYLTHARMAALANPAAAATFQYGTNGRHSWIGHSLEDPTQQLRYREFIRVVAQFVRERAPANADLESWGY
ncbi:MAG: alpha/beta hydrolase-fold protein [Pseudomonadota bacterium]